MDACFAVGKGSYMQPTVMYLSVPEMNIVGLVETIAFVFLKEKYVIVYLF